MHNLLDLSFIGQVSNGNTGKRTIDFETFDENGLRDEPECGDFFENAIIGRLVENDGVLGLVFDLALGPFLLFGGFSTRTGSGGSFCFGLRGRVSIRCARYLDRQTSIHLHPMQ